MSDKKNSKNTSQALRDKLNLSLKQRLVRHAETHAASGRSPFDPPHEPPAAKPAQRDRQFLDHVENQARHEVDLIDDLRVFPPASTAAELPQNSFDDMADDPSHAGSSLGDLLRASKASTSSSSLRPTRGRAAPAPEEPEAPAGPKRDAYLKSPNRHRQAQQPAVDPSLPKPEQDLLGAIKRSDADWIRQHAHPDALAPARQEMILAAALPKPECVQALFDAGLRFNAKDGLALRTAIAQKHFGALEILKAKGAQGSIDLETLKAMSSWRRAQNKAAPAPFTIPDRAVRVEPDSPQERREPPPLDLGGSPSEDLDKLLSDFSSQDAPPEPPSQFPGAPSWDEGTAAAEEALAQEPSWTDGPAPSEESALEEPSPVEEPLTAPAEEAPALAEEPSWLDEPATPPAEQAPAFAEEPSWPDEPATPPAEQAPAFAEEPSWDDEPLTASGEDPQLPPEAPSWDGAPATAEEPASNPLDDLPAAPDDFASRDGLADEPPALPEPNPNPPAPDEEAHASPHVDSLQTAQDAELADAPLLDASMNAPAPSAIEARKPASALSSVDRARLNMFDKILAEKQHLEARVMELQMYEEAVVGLEEERDRLLGDLEASQLAQEEAQRLASDARALAAGADDREREHQEALARAGAEREADAQAAKAEIERLSHAQANLSALLRESERREAELREANAELAAKAQELAQREPPPPEAPDWLRGTDRETQARKHLLVDAIVKGEHKSLDKISKNTAVEPEIAHLALAFAAEAGQIRCAQWLVESMEVHPGHGGELALRRAVEARQFEMVRWLATHGADIHHAEEFALRLAASNDDVPMVDFLIDLGANPRAAQERALREAADNDAWKAFKALLAHGCTGRGPDGEMIPLLADNEIAAEHLAWIAAQRSLALGLDPDFAKRFGAGRP